MTETIASLFKLQGEYVEDAQARAMLLDSEGRTIRIDFRDNGVGFPEDIDFKNTRTLGMQLVNLLVRQLDGSIQLLREGGTRYLIALTALE